MTKNMTISEILSAYEALNNFIKKDIPMPGKLSWIISDNLDELKKHAEKFQQKKEYLGQQFIKSGKTSKNDDGTESVASEHMTEYVEKIQELLLIERELIIEPVSIEEFKKLDSLSVLDIKALEIMVNKEVN